MIGLLRGIASVDNQNLIVDVNGVGYRVEVGSSLLNFCQDQQEITLYVYTHVREDKIELFGFARIEEKKLFELLLAVSGVGPKMALAITDRGASQIRTAVQEADVSFFSAVPRVGKRMAQKIIIELKPKLGSLKELELGPLDPNRAEALTALESLGFSEVTAREALENIDSTLSLPEMIKQALKKVS